MWTNKQYTEIMDKLASLHEVSKSIQNRLTSIEDRIDELGQNEAEAITDTGELAAVRKSLQERDTFIQDILLRLLDMKSVPATPSRKNGRMLEDYIARKNNDVVKLPG